MTLDDVTLDAGERMEKSVAVLKEDLRAVRGSGATVGLVDRLRVDYYGSPTPLIQIAAIATPEPQTIAIRPYDPNALRDIERAILTSDLGLTPQSDGKIIRLNVPPLSEERRRQLVHHVKTLGENAKLAIRSIRRDANKAIDQAEDDKVCGEDDARRAKDEVQELTHESEGQVDALVQEKTAEIMKV
jgi:ribosome recycling factor